MNITSYIKYVIPIFILSFFGCEKDAKLDLPVLADVLVVNSHFQPDSSWIVRVTKSRQVGAGFSFEEINNASVSVFQGSNLVEQLQYIPEQQNQLSHYAGSVHAPLANVDYRIEVSAPGFETVQSTDFIPMGSPSAPDLELVLRSEGVGPSKFSISHDDVSGNEEYYNLVLETRTVTWEIVGTDTVFTRSNFEESILSVLTEGDGLAPITTGVEFYSSYLSSFQGLVYNDSKFNNNQLQTVFDLFVTAPENLETSGTFSELRVALRNVSLSYFEFYRTLVLAEDSEEDPFAEPVLIYNNIENGLGNFSGFQSTYSNVYRF